jgi:hypothetical protein
VVDTGTTMLVTKLGKRLPDDLAEAKESKVSAKSTCWLPPIPKFRNKYSQKRNGAAIVPIFSFVCL